MATLYTEQSKNIRKTWALMLVFFAIIAALGWFLSHIYNSPGIFYIALVFSLIMNFASYWWSDKIVLSMTHAQEITHESENPMLWNVVENLSITAGLPMPRVYIVNDPAPNAFATGRDKNHAALAVTSGLLSMLDRSELEGVIGHELSHVGNRDILISTVVVVLVGLITLLADFFLRFGFRRRDDREGGQAQAILMIIGVVFIILSPIIATLIQLAISRKREFLADADGALLTRYPEGLASALRKIGQYSRPMQTASNATAHLFISNPFGATGKDDEQVGWLQKLFMTHPPIQERIKALLGNRAQ